MVGRLGLDPVRIGIGSVARGDLVGDRGRPRQRHARAGEVAQALEAAALGFLERLEQIHGDPRILLEARRGGS